MAPAASRIAIFGQFWPYYVGEHSKALTRWLHLAGTLGGSVALVVMIAAGYGRYFLLALIYAYGLAWIGHFFVEKNQPATFKYPLWSLAADYKMCALMLLGRMDREVHKIIPARRLDHELL